MAKSRMMDVTQASEYLKLNPYTIREMLRSGTIKGYKIKNRWRMRKFDLDTYIRSTSNVG